MWTGLTCPAGLMELEAWLILDTMSCLIMELLEEYEQFN
jgi:hypothetical protein